MNVVGTLNSFAGTSSNSYELPTKRKEVEALTVEVEATLDNPYRQNGVSDTLWSAFVKLSQPLDLYSQKSLEERLFSNIKSDSDIVTKALEIKRSTEKEFSNIEIFGLIQEKNSVLAQFKQPPMSPLEEKNFVEQLKSRIRHQVTLLDGILAVAKEQSYEPLEVAA